MVIADRRDEERVEDGTEEEKERCSLLFLFFFRKRNKKANDCNQGDDLERTIRMKMTKCWNCIDTEKRWLQLI